MDPFVRKIVIISALIIVGIFLFIFGINQSTDKNLGTSNEYVDPEGPAVMVNSENLFRIIDDSHQFTELRGSLSMFARTTLEPYVSGGVVEVVFNVESETVNDSKTIEIVGKFNAVNNGILVSLTPKNFGRISISITNIANNNNIDDELPSNNKANQYIGELPFAKDDYSIDYIQSTDTFVIRLYERNPNLSTAAENQIIAGMDLESIDDVKVDYIFPPLGG